MNLKNKLRVGILGCANIARRYSIKAFQTLPNVEVVYIASREQEKAKVWAEEFGIPKFGTYEELIKSDQVDAVYIPLPIGLHKEWILAAAKNKKHVLSEKSLAPDLVSVKEIIDVCKQNDVVLFENFTCDYHPQHQKVLEIMGGGIIGRPHTFLSVYGFPMIPGDNFRYKKELGGSALSESGAYQVYTARKIFAQEPVSVMAHLKSDPGTNVDMSGSVIMEFENDLSAEFTFNLNAVYQNHYTLWGTEGLVKVGRAYAIPPEMKPVVELLKNENRQEVVTQIEVPSANHFELIFKEFCDLVLNKESKKEKIKAKFEDILNQAKVLEAIRISSKENTKVFISELN